MHGVSVSGVRSVLTGRVQIDGVVSYNFAIHENYVRVRRRKVVLYGSVIDPDAISHDLHVSP